MTNLVFFAKSWTDAFEKGLITGVFFKPSANFSTSSLWLSWIAADLAVLISSRSLFLLQACYLSLQACTSFNQRSTSLSPVAYTLFDLRCRHAK